MNVSALSPVARHFMPENEITQLPKRVERVGAYQSQATRPTRVLIIAEAANPSLTSAALVGWSCTRAIAAEVDAHIVTEWRNRDDFLRAGLIEGKDFTAIQ